MNLRSCLITLWILCSLTACASSSERAVAKWNRDNQRVAAVLRTRSEPDALAAAGLLLLASQPVEARELLARAAATPDRPYLLWLHISSCRQSTGCDTASMQEQIHRGDPDNGAAWVGALHRAAVQHDEAGVDAALGAIGRTTRFDIYWNTLTARLSWAVAGSGQMNLPTAITAVIGELATVSIPAYQDVSTVACKGDTLDRPGRRDLCRAVARCFRNGDTYITEMIGLAIAKRVWPTDSAEYRDALEARRVYEYRVSQLDKTDAWRVMNQKRAQEYLHLLESHRTEQDVFKAQLEERHIDPTPPVDWAAKPTP